jgi:cytochrome c oxidase assembly protein subunit 15
MLYVQIILGALLRHPGTGVDPVFASIHIAGALVVVGLVLATFSFVRKHFDSYRLLNKAAWMMLGAVGVQITLGFCAFAVLLVETQMAQRSVLQVVLNSAHLVVGALLMAAAVSLALLSLRRPAGVVQAPSVLTNQPV